MNILFLAGMPSIRLTDAAGARLDVISFFLVAILIMAFLFQRCWNGLSKGALPIPTLSYRLALGAIFVLTLLCGLVLTMISGARELMTPGAWEKTAGSTHRLSTPSSPPTEWVDTARNRTLSRLRDGLWNHAAAHEGRLPAGAQSPLIATGDWLAPDPDGTPYLYLGAMDPGARGFGFDADGAALGDPAGYVLAYEPEPFGAWRFVILSDGRVVKMKTFELVRLVEDRQAAGLAKTAKTDVGDVGEIR